MDGIDVSIIVPVFNKLAFTRQCLERLGRDTSGPTFEVFIVDNGSSDDTEPFFRAGPDFGYSLTYLRNTENLGFSRANNVGAERASGRYLLFLNNDTLATPGWLAAMVGVAEREPTVGIVGIKQLFPYTNRIHHTGIIFTADKRPQHIYPHADASLPYVNREREYQAVTGSCLLISRELFNACGQFDVGYRNGYEDIDLCLQARARGRSVVCCTSGFIYHYGQISETRTLDDDANAARLASRWAGTITPDDLRYFREDRRDIETAAPAPAAAPHRLDRDAIYFGDDLATDSALSWVTDELIRALERQGRQVSIRDMAVIAPASSTRRAFLEQRMRRGPVFGGVQVRWSHYWPQHLRLDLNGRLNLELFVINYQFGAPGSEPWDYWLQCLPQNHYLKLPLSQFCRDVLTQIGVPASEGTIVRPGYAPEIPHVASPKRNGRAFRLLSVTNSHDLERYGTRLLLEAYWSVFSRRDDVVLVLKDYGVSSGDTTLRDLLHERSDCAAVEYVTAFTTKERLIELYRSCDAFVSAHRGEGYGMKILDALACGLPVIAPFFGGPMDFCTTENSLPVDFTLAPVGDCLDTRALRITNRPLWAEPSVSSLGTQMRVLADSPSLASSLGARGATDVLNRFTWDAAASALTALIDTRSATASRPALPSAPVPAPVTESSPYWMGCRMSVIIPTYNRSATLRQCLDALERQTVLPQEFEVIVVDDGSTDETRATVEAARTAFRLTYVYQANAGPGAARNLGLRHATGEFVMYIGDDIIADERLLESHLTAHATRLAAGTAVLGHIDWAPGLERTPVMDFICGPSTLQFAYAFIPTLPSLDFRFFYTSNLSLKRTFLVEAADEGVVFDSDFTKAAFEDSEFALRLESRGLEIAYCADAKAYHDHWMDLDAFSRRERSVGQMAVVFYRKHPQIDDQLQVRWIGDWSDAVEEVLGRPELDAKLSALNDQTEAFLRSLAAMLDDLNRLQHDVGTSVLRRPGAVADHTLLESVYSVIFDVARTRGKVEEWYRGVGDLRRIDVAVRLICCARRLEFLSASPLEIQKLRGTVYWLETDVFHSLEARIVDLEHHLAIPPSPGHTSSTAPALATSAADLHARLSTLNTKLGATGGRRRRLDRMVFSALRRADLRIQHELGQRTNGPWLARYHAVRRRLRRWLPAPPGPRR